MKHATANRGLSTPRLLRFTALAAFLVAALAVLGMSAGSAKADPVQMKFDTGTINLGGEDGTWAKLIDPELDPPDPASTITVDYDAGSGDFTAPKEAFFFPPKRIEGLETGNGLLPVVDAKIDIKGDGEITGNFDAATGVAEADIPVFVLIDVYQAGSPVSSAMCSVSGFSLELSTAGNLSDPGDPAADPPRPAAEYDAAPFVGFPGGEDGAPGALIAQWAALPASEIVSGGLAFAVCPALDDMLGGPGGVFMNGSATDSDDPGIEAPELAPQITSAPPATTEATTAAFAFEAGEGEPQPVTGFECKLDAGEFSPCDEGTKNYAGQTPGCHTFTVRATNVIGAGPEASHTWTINGPEECPPGQVGTPPNCETPPPPPGKLGALKIKPKVKAVKRGKKATFKVAVRNAGKGTAKAVKVCVTAPKKFVKVKKCVKGGNLAAGKSRNVKFKVTVKKKARKGKKLTLKFKATSNGAGQKSGKAKVKVK